MNGQVGFYGKLPSAGDFVQRRLPAAFVERWDRHFQRAIETGRRELGGQWSAALRDGLAWRFVLPAQVCGDGAWCGVIGPAEDCVGRSFPMMLAAPWAGDPAGILGNHAWFDALERVYRGAQYEAVSVETFDARVAALPHPLASARHAAQFWQRLDWDGGQWQLGSTEGSAAAVLLTEAWRQLHARPGAWCLWWTQGAQRVITTRGLPRSYATLLEPVREQDFASSSAAHGFDRDELGRVAPGSARPMPDRRAAAPDPRVRLDEWHEHFEWATDAAASEASAATAWRRTPQTAGAANASLSAQENKGVSASRRDFAARVSTAFPEPSPALAGTSLLHLDQGRTLLISADDGPPDPRRRAALSMRAAALASAPDLGSLQASLLALQMPLCAVSEDPLEPVREEGVALAARFVAGRVHLMRIGAAAAWHWRRGVLRPLFVERAAGAGGEFDDLLFGDAWLAMPGLGTPQPPHCDEATSEFGAGDRLVLLATRALAQLPQAVVAEALNLASCDNARVHLAASAGLGPEPAHWPLAVIGSEA
jgi:type VI secretion system ImpM family protein